GAFRKDDCGTFMFIQVTCEFHDLCNGLPGIFPVYENRSPVFQVEGYTRDPFPQFLFADELRVVLPQVPDDGRNVIGALMVGNEDAGPVGGEMVRMFKSKTGTKNVQTAQQEKVEDVDTLFMRFIASQLQGDPLDG